MKSEPKKLVTRGVEEEPGVGSGEIPILFFGILAGLFFLGLLYLDKYGGGFNNRVYRPFESYGELAGAQPRSGGDERILKGKQVYETTCQICHQANGLGTAGQFPPLDGSEWVNGPVPRLARIPIHGLGGPITVKGEPWNGSMPAIGAALNDEQLATLLTFIRQAWGNKSGPVADEQVKKAREAESARSQPWTGEELMKVPETE